MKIGLLGCAGLGKSSIARMVAAKRKINFLESKNLTRPVLERIGYQYSENSFVEMTLAKKDIEFELVSNRIQHETGSFITDRTTLECFSYAFLRLDTYSKEDFSLLEETCLENIKTYDYLYYLPFDYGWQEKNGIRTVNKEFQWMVDTLIKNVIDRWDLQVKIPSKGDVKKIASQISKETVSLIPNS